MSDIRRLSVTIGPNPPARLDKAMARDVPDSAGLSRSRLAKLIDAGGVTLNGAPVDGPRMKVAEGDVLELQFAEASEVEARPEDIALDVVFEDDALIVVNKPVGMVVHPAPGTPSGTLVNALLHHCGDSLSGIGGEKRPGIVHRIDKDTSGLLVVAKSDKAHTGLAAQFEKHTVTRHYHALCYGVPDAGDPRLRGVRGASFEAGNILKMTTQLARHKTDRQKQAVVWSNGRHAVTRARVVEDFNGVAAHLECWLETGRTHQIRVHMAYAGFGLIGDQTYGGRRKLPAKSITPEAADAVSAFPRQALHAASLGFVHPESGAQMQFSAEMPKDMCELAQKLRL
ncbi:pseudouridine synthase [Actibacterium mucosum KCTC 23349]|uniref:Pseudouridine synthase n=1 Tax=Actibacterium mucosum KCTC 23349 TaxID=1454373 RepID=A0A037ZI97_9RHOB|nr:RluA family pseudouridine synthase [Actibacterium mucosum]KAJ55277.1 pseudouridine synthase [Actibacterium mucosum KCTC 23349]